MKREKDPQAQRYPRPALPVKPRIPSVLQFPLALLVTAGRAQLILQVETEKLTGRRVRGDGRNFEKYSKV